MKKGARAPFFYTGSMPKAAEQSSMCSFVRARRAAMPDARIAVVVTLAYSIALFFVDTWMGMGVFAVALAVALACARVRVGMLAKGIAPLLFILAFTVLAHIPQGIDEGMFYALRILLLVIATLAVAFSYDDAQLVRAFSSFGRPLRVLGAPVDDIASMFSIALRFIPASMDEFNRVASAQRSRGAALDEGDAIARMRRWGNVLVPMLVGLFRRAGTLACAMEARCYGGAERRTSLHGTQRLGARDIVAAALCAAVCLCAGVLL